MDETFVTLVPSHVRPSSDAALLHWHRELHMLMSPCMLLIFPRMHPCDKEDISACTVTQDTHSYIHLVHFVNSKAKRWYCVRYVRILLFLILFFTR